MNLIDKIGSGLSAAVDVVVDKNRQLAQLNRLSAVIKNETEVISRAYIALGKQYYKVLEGTAEDTDVSSLLETIKYSELRLKKAKARYDYIKAFGIPGHSVKEETAEDTEDIISKDEEAVPAEDEESFDEEDITIAYVDEDVPVQSNDEEKDISDSVITEILAEDEKSESEKTEDIESAEVESSDNETSTESESEKTIAQKAADVVNILKNRRTNPKNKSVEADSETAPETDEKA